MSVDLYNSHNCLRDYQVSTPSYSVVYISCVIKNILTVHFFQVKKKNNTPYCSLSFIELLFPVRGTYSHCPQMKFMIAEEEVIFLSAQLVRQL